MKLPAPQHIYDYIIIAARVWLAYTLIRYGYGKLTDAQFGLSETELNMPVKELNLFRLSWYLADHEPFKSFIGITQIITGGLLFFRYTCITGAFMSIPIWLNILIWDMTFMGWKSVFTLRLSYYLILTVLILLHCRKNVFLLLKNSLQRDQPRFEYPMWAYLGLPLVGIMLELIPFLFRLASTLFTG